MSDLSNTRMAGRLRQQLVWASGTLSPHSAVCYAWWKLRHRLAQRVPLFRFADPPRLVALRLNHRLGGGRLWIPLTPVSLYTLGQVWVSRMYCVRTASQVRTIVDLGANIGLTARWLLNEFPGSRLVAVEPDQSNVAVLERNLEDSASATVIVGCIAPQDGAVLLQLDERADSHRVTSCPGERTRLVPAISMLSLMARCGLDRIDLLKVDIEGAEAALLEDCGQWIGRVGCMVIEVHERELPIDELERLMVAHGFRVERSARFAMDRVATCTNRSMPEA